MQKVISKTHTRISKKKTCEQEQKRENFEKKQRERIWQQPKNFVKTRPSRKCPK